LQQRGQSNVGFDGPARWLKSPTNLKHAENTLKGSPGTYLGKPDDLSTVRAELINAEVTGMNAVLDGDEENALMAAGDPHFCPS